MGGVIWQTGGGCEVCGALAGQHDLVPQRPHPFCQCQVVSVDRFGSGLQPGTCLYDEPLLLYQKCEVSARGANVEEDIVDYWEATYEVDFQCKDGTIMSATFTYTEDVLQEDRFPFPRTDIGTEDLFDVMDQVMENGLRLWEDIADDECPACE